MNDCPRCGKRFNIVKSWKQHLKANRCTREMLPSSVEAGVLIDKLHGLSHADAARLCGVHPSTVRRWRRTRLISPGMLTAVLNVVDRRDDAPPPVRARGGRDHPIHAHATWTSSGWILDAYRIHGDPSILDPVDSIARSAQAGQRWPTLHDAHRFARRRFGRRLAVLTPEPIDQEATA